MILHHIQLYHEVVFEADKNSGPVVRCSPTAGGVFPLSLMFAHGENGDAQTAAMIDALHEARRLSGYAVHETVHPEVS